MANLPKPSGLSIVWSNTGTKVDPGESKYNTGHVVEIPPYQTMNWIDWRQDAAVAHINQHGVPQWDATTEYQGNLSYTKGSNGIVYKCLQTCINVDPVNPLSTTQWAIAFETYGAAAAVQAQLTTHLADYSTLANIGNTAAARVNLSVWSRAEADARFALKAGSATQTFSVAAATLPEHAVRLGQVNGFLAQATEASLGVAALATNAKAAAGTDDLTIMTPLKTNTVFLSKAGNLAGLANVATARTNLGLGNIATLSSTLFLQVANNLSDVNSTVVARANLGLTSTAIQPETYFLRTANNLSEVPDKAVARTNMGLTTTATTALSTIMLKAENLAGLTNVAAARANLGLTSIVLLPDTFYNQRLNNLSDVGNVQAARNNLGLGSAATMDAIGTLGSLNFSSQRSGNNAMTVLPNGMVMQMGSATIQTNTRINFLVGMSSITSIQLTICAVGSTIDLQGRTAGVGAVDAGGFYAYGSTNSGPAVLGVYWQATGWI